MNSPFLERVQKHNLKLSNGHRRVVECLVREPKLLAFATAAEIGRRAGVSESTVIRLAYALGYRGFAELQEETQGVWTPHLAQEIVSRAAIEFPGGTGVLTRVIEQDALLLRRTLELVSLESFEGAVELLATARHIYVVGGRASYAVARFLGHTLRTQLGSATFLEADHPDFLSNLSGLGPDTALVGVAFPRYSESTLRIVDYAVQHGCPVVGITDSPVSPLGRRAQVVLMAPVESPAATPSYVAPLSLATALITSVALRRKEDVERQLARIEQVHSEWRLVPSKP